MVKKIKNSLMPAKIKKLNLDPFPTGKQQQHELDISHEK